MDTDTLQGDWQVVRIERPGSRGNPDELVRLRYIFDKDCATLMNGAQKGWEGVFRVDRTEEPKAIDFTGTADPHNGEKAFGIYRVEVDALTICLGKKRPTEFVGKEDILLELSRII
jgi:uncharacterized protein (TIGR03067 family)